MTAGAVELFPPCRELMKKQGIYHQLYTNQFQDEQTAAALAV